MLRAGTTRLRSIWRALQGAARVIVVLSLIAAFEVVFPDYGGSVRPTNASGFVTNGLQLAVDASNTASYSGSGTTWTDISGNGRHGTLYSPTLAASTSSSPRMFTTGSNKYMMFPSGFADFTGGFTVQATVDLGNADVWERIIDFSSDRNGGSFARPDGDNSDNILFARAGTTNDIVLEFYGAYQSSSQYLGACTATNGIVSGLNNYAATVAPSGGSTTCTIYRNGVALPTTNNLSRMPNNVTRVGNFAARSNWTADGDMGGSYKSLVIYNRALSGAEIAANYTADQRPLAPTSLTTGSVTTSSVTLSWTAPTSAGSSSIQDYVVEFSTDNSTWNTFADGTSTATSATVTGLASGTAHYFRVSATNASLTGPVSATAQTTTVDPPPTLVSSAVNAAGTQLTLTFNEAMSATVPPVSSFVVRNAGVPNPVTSVSASGSTLVLALREPVYAGQAVTVSYTDPTGANDASAAQDLAGNDAETISTTTVTTNSASTALPSSARLLSLGTQTLVNLSGAGGNIRGITSDGTKVYMWRAGDNTKMWEVPLSSITANPGGSRTVTPTSWTITNAPSMNSTTQLVYSSGCLFLFNTAGSLQCIDLATRSASTVAAPVGAQFPTGQGWMTGNLIGFPDGRIGKVGQPSGTTTTLRIYTVNGTGSSATLSFDRDMTLEDITTGWPGDDHGAATDGTYLYRTNYMTGGYKVWRLRDGVGVNSMIAFNGDGTGACGGSGTFCNANPSVAGSPILSNATFLGRDHVGGRILVGDFDGARFYMTESINPTHTVTYDSQGGPAVPAESWIQGTSLTLPNPTRAGYTFNGWSTTAAGSTLVYQTTTPTRSGNSIVYSPGYGKTGGVASTLTANGTTFNRVRYRMEANYSGTLRYADVSFDKWSGATIADLAVPDLADARTIKQNVSNLSVDSNWPGFTNVASIVTNGSGKSGRVELWPWDYAPNTTGILPAGNGTVYDEDDTATGANYYGSFQVHNITDDQTVLAWNRHFDANPDIGFGNYLGSSNTDWTFAQKTNFDLATWRLQIYIGDLLQGGSSYSPPNTSSFTLYAQWTANPLTVTYDSQLGSAVSAGSTVTGGSIASSPGTPTRAGYTFDGWFAASSGGSAITFPYAHGRTSDFTLYAQWTPNPLTVTYDSRGGSAVSAGSTVTGGSIASSPGSPTRDGHVFRGWFTATTGGSAISFPYTHGRTSNFTLYAQWLVVQTGFTITGAPGSLAYNGTVDLDTSGGNGTGAVVFASTTSGVCSVNASSGLVTMLSGSGTCSIAATKAGDSTYDATSASVNITATKAAQSALTVSGSASGAYGATLSLSTTGGTTGGMVTWSDGSSTSCTVDSSGSVSIIAGTGTCTITATMAGNGNYLPVTSSTFTVTVSRATQTALTVTSTSVTYGQTLALTYSGGSGTGAVTWEVVLGVCTIDGTTVTPGDAGSSCQVRVSKAQDGNYLAAQSSSTTINVGRATQTALTVTSTSVTFGQTLTLTHSGGSGTGAVTWSVVSGSGSTCTISGAVLTPGDAGSTCVVRVSKAQDTNWLARQSSNTTITVDRASQTGFSITSAGSFTTGSSLSLTASGGQSTGSVTWSLQSGTCTLSGTVLISTRGGIVCSVQATRAGDSNWFSASDTQTITVDKIVQTISFRSTPPSSATVGTTYTVTVDSSAFLAPTIVIANQSTSVCSISAGVVTFNSAGTCVISASQPGNDTYTVAAASQSVTVLAAAAAAPAVTSPSAVATPVAPETTVAAATQTATTTTTTTTVVAPPRGGGAVAATTTTTTSTTTTTTTTVPADPSSPQTGADGLPPDLDAGEATAMVRGQSVDVKVERVDDALVLTLPNDVKVSIGRTTPGGESVAVAADGVLRIFREELADVTVDGLVPGTTWTIYMFSDPVELGRGEASGSGAVETSVRIPKDAPHGGHTLQFNGVGPGGEIVSMSMGFEVLERENDTWLVVSALGLAVLLALLGGRPIFVNRRRRRNSYA